MSKVEIPNDHENLSLKMIDSSILRLEHKVESLLNENYVIQRLGPENGGHSVILTNEINQIRCQLTQLRIKRLKILGQRVAVDESL